ncbi:SLC13 family permease [Paraburkholderia hayleyella]|uniref:SLC13 family permease n=1 Tax=Paraburkholderia hayleyella TaxID=2152889 RepID=UPI0012913916|nr:SLC13 family permease [Paraburkholderia hayleyella]
MQRAGNLLRNGLSQIAREPLLAILVTALVVLQMAYPQRWASLPTLVDWQTVLTLGGLLILAKAVETSGFLNWMAHRVVHRVRSERGLACLLVSLAAGLSTLLTNDVALFVVIPLVLSLHRLTPLPLKRLVVVVALAVNAGSVLTPLGNPQNLFLWQRSGVSFGVFVWTLAPLCAVLMFMLYALTAILFSPKTLDLSQDTAPGSVDRILVSVTALLFVGFIWLADAGQPGIGLAGIAISFLLWRREIVFRIDGFLLLIFALMFIVLRSVVALPWIHASIERLVLTTPISVYAAAAILSQGISNVPAAIILAEFSNDWRALAFGVSVGGFGIAIGSLANLIAVRLAQQRGIWPLFHLISLPFWAIAGIAGSGLLLWGR